MTLELLHFLLVVPFYDRDDPNWKLDITTCLSTPSAKERDQAVLTCNGWTWAYINGRPPEKFRWAVLDDTIVMLLEEIGWVHTHTICHDPSNMTLETFSWFLEIPSPTPFELREIEKHWNLPEGSLRVLPHEQGFTLFEGAPKEISARDVRLVHSNTHAYLAVRFEYQWWKYIIGIL